MTAIPTANAGLRDDSPPPPPPPPARSPSLSPPPDDETPTAPAVDDAASAKPSPRKKTPKKPAAPRRGRSSVTLAAQVSATNETISAAAGAVPASAADAVARTLRLDTLEAAVIGQDPTSHRSLIAGIRAELARIAARLPLGTQALPSTLAELEDRVEARNTQALAAADANLQEELGVLDTQIAALKADLLRTMDVAQSAAPATEHAQLAVSVNEIRALILGNIDAVNTLGGRLNETTTLILRMSHSGRDHSHEDRGRKRRRDDSRSPSPRPPPRNRSSHGPPRARSPPATSRARSQSPPPPPQGGGDNHRSFGAAVIHSRARYNNNYGADAGAPARNNYSADAGPSARRPPPQRRSLSPAPPPAPTGQFCALFGKVAFTSRSRATPATIFTQVMNVIERHPRAVQLRVLPKECAWVKDSAFVTIHFATEKARDDFISGWGTGCLGYDRVRASRA